MPLGVEGHSFAPVPQEPIGDDWAGVVPSAPVRPIFCTVCGSRMPPEWDLCQACPPSFQSRFPTIAGPGVQIGSSLWLYFTLLAASIIGVLIAFAQDSNDNLVGLEIGISIAHSVIVIVFGVAHWNHVREPLTRFGGLRWYPIAIGLAPVTFLVATLALEALKLLPEMIILEYAPPYLEAGYGWFTIIFWICVQPAIIEEIAFRGVVLGGLRRVLTDREALVISTFLFGLLHLSLPSMPHLLLIGGVLGWLRLRSGSLLPGMVMHFLHNLLCLWGEAAGI